MTRVDIIGMIVLVLALLPPASAQTSPTTPPLTGSAALGDWRSDAPGMRRRIAPSDLPPPYASASASNPARIVAGSAAARPLVPAGFTIEPFARGLDQPRVIRVAPNGDIFIAETSAGRVRVLRARDGATRADSSAVFADELELPFGIAFHPPGADPQWLYVANNNSVVRFPYRSGDLTPRGPAQTVVGRLSRSSGGHSTRDIAFSADGRRMFVSVGSGSNVAGGLPSRTPDEIRAWEAQHGLGAIWGGEAERADVLVFDPDGRNGRIFATGIRNCVGLATQPQTGDLWCATNERDGLGDDLVPDYLTRVRDRAFYGWPWFYIGDHEEPRHKGARPIW
jgi:glucose/arabinose dehydrogenase